MITDAHVSLLSLQNNGTNTEREAQTFKNKFYFLKKDKRCFDEELPERSH